MPRHVFITGGSRGIGRATAEAFLEEGDYVTIISPNTVMTAVRELRKKFPERIRCVEGDISDSDAVPQHMNKARAMLGPIEVLVNCAGIFTPNTELTTISSWNKVIATNLTACFLTSQEVIGHMMHARRGKIINVSSIAGLSYSKLGSEAYTVSKAGVIALTKHQAATYGPWNINVNCICPGQTQTDMLKSCYSPKSDDEEMLMKNIPMLRFARAYEQASVIVFLASEAASYINGAIINVSGGQQ
ncbi:hypothetical protein LCGC14_0235490 [marine sediment metagenome]|uniref:Uncharacterized protein n=1 Tax=marine sediment metagenome TaxID=412755 RepID=A0A0F9XD60_9ZZZZ